MKRIEKFENAKSIVSDLQGFVIEHNVTFMDAILMYCESNKLEIEYVAEIVARNSTIKAAIQEEAENLNFLKKTSRLPV